MKPRTLLVLALTAAPMLNVNAEPFGKEQTSELLNIMQPSRTAQLLEMQRSGNYASDKQTLLPGKAQKRIYERYLNSFSHPIPDSYISEDFVE